ncbi:hypothetical protein H2199_001569 [Coniosporium tulheliwenetii]|uniref:Uncharacterized protein n=1 Tax=Coniosporium tulheliwenetii TaxID=3383036 RepID=A0ACC2ZJR4_9PEZI|nr:hypothetical protein H2199_001569 [Cladosporium sp. JES 115]
MLWGPDLNIIYNAAYPSIIANKHPRLLGMRPQEGFPEAWEGFEPFFKRCQETGQGVFLEHLLTFLDRGFGPQEETYYSFGFMPIFGDDDTIAGWFQNCFETTKHRITERRMSTLLSISETTAAASDLESFWKLLLRAIEKNEHDMPWVVVYAGVDQSEVSTGSDAHTTGSSTTKRFEVLCTIGVDMGHAAAPTRTDIAKGSKGFYPFFEQAAEAQDPLVLLLEEGTLPIDLVVGLDTRGWCDPCKGAVICPIRPTTTNPNSTETVLGYLVMGMNTRRPYDDEYRTFHRLLNRQIVTSMASVLLLEEETRRGRTIAEQAALDQRKFEEQLSLRTRELERSREQLQNFADCVPVGIFVLTFTPDNTDGTYQYRNERWFELTGDSRDNNIGSDSPIWGRMDPEDVPAVRRAWSAVRTTKTSISFEFRVAQRSQYVGAQEHQLDPQGDIDCTWILCYAFSVWDDDKTLRSVIGSITDITPQKYAEIIQKQRMEDALEAQRRQETFIDVTSHEMRNPLSAIMISADDIMTSLRTLKTDDVKMTPQFEELVESSIDAAGTISHCASHQKTIVDDILTISKLDSGLFSITPVEVQPLAIIKDLLRMFEGELQTAKITQKTYIDDSFHDLALDRVLLDPSRLLQILINLVTNSIKFTQLQERRIITIHMAASLEKPAKSVTGIEYLPLRKEREDLTNRPEWGKGEIIYLRFAVEDTGCGLTADEKKLLFLRFSQAPRTHVNYGGSGLGLFICRELTELQGGSIGVASEAGQGSTFAFYIKARRCEHAPTESQTLKEAFGNSHSPHANNLQRSAAGRKKVQEPLSARQDRAAPSGSLPSDGPAPPESTNAPHVYDILITEDNVINQQVLSKQLLKLGHRVSIANQGQEALDFLRTTKYWKGNESDGKNLDVVLMDIEMPVMGGLECVSKIRELERDGSLVRPVQVIAITANARVEQIDKALDAGMVSSLFRRVPPMVDHR